MILEGVGSWMGQRGQRMARLFRTWERLQGVAPGLSELGIGVIEGRSSLGMGMGHPLGRRLERQAVWRRSRGLVVKSLVI